MHYQYLCIRFQIWGEGCLVIFNPLTKTDEILNILLEGRFLCFFDHASQTPKLSEM